MLSLNNFKTNEKTYRCSNCGTIQYIVCSQKNIKEYCKNCKNTKPHRQIQ